MSDSAAISTSPNTRLTSIEVGVQELDEGPVPALLLNQRRHVVHDVERVSPLVTLGPARGHGAPRSVRPTRLHEPGIVVEDRPGRGEGAGSEERRVIGLVESGREDGHSVVVVCTVGFIVSYMGE